MGHPLRPAGEQREPKICWHPLVLDPRAIVTEEEIAPVTMRPKMGEMSFRVLHGKVSRGEGDRCDKPEAGNQNSAGRDWGMCRMMTPSLR